MQFLHGGWPEGLAQEEGPQRYGPRASEWVAVDPDLTLAEVLQRPEFAVSLADTLEQCTAMQSVLYLRVGLPLLQGWPIASPKSAVSLRPRPEEVGCAESHTRSHDFCVQVPGIPVFFAVARGSDFMQRFLSEDAFRL